MPADGEGAAQVHGDDRVELLLGHVDEHPVAEDARVVDHDVEPSEGVDRRLDDAARSGVVRDVVGVGDRLTPQGRDLVHDLLCGAGVRARPIDGAAEIVDDHARTLASEGKRVLAPDTPTSPRDDDDTTFADARHGASSSPPRRLASGCARDRTGCA